MNALEIAPWPKRGSTSGTARGVRKVTSHRAAGAEVVFGGRQEGGVHPNTRPNNFGSGRRLLSQQGVRDPPKSLRSALQPAGRGFESPAPTRCQNYNVLPGKRPRFV